MLVREKNFDIRKIADSGQCFRMNETKDGVWKIVARDRLLWVAEVEGSKESKKSDKSEESGKDHIYDFSCTEEEYEDFWKDYFDIACDYSRFTDRIDKKDKYLTKAAVYGYGMKILRQDIFETLISFIISQRKNIPAIKNSVEKICEKFGHDIGGAYSFPTPEELFLADLESLKECSLGYRAEYIYKTVRLILEGEFDLDGLRRDKEISNKLLLEKLMNLPGVGIKVANCTSLFGFHRLEAFPRDVWIKRIEDNYYNGHFDEDKYQGFAGVLQQYMFYYERSK